MVYARILAKSRGVLAQPIHRNGDILSNSGEFVVPVNILYESLLLGVLPASLLPTVILLAGIVILAVLCIRPAIKALDEFTEPLREEFASKKNT